MVFDPIRCRKCHGSRFFHIADRVAFAGDKSHFSLGGLADKAKILGLRVQGSNDDLVALISKANPRTSTSVKKAKMRGVRIMGPDEFQKELKLICDGNVPSKPNPRLATLITNGGKIYAWGLSREEEKILASFLKRNGLRRGVMRKESLALAITNSTYIKTSGAKILKALGVPVYDFTRIKKTLLD